MAQHPALPYLRSSEKGKVVSAAEAVRLIRDGDTVATGGFVGIGFAEEIAIALEELYLSAEAGPRTAPASPVISPSSMRPVRATGRIAGLTISPTMAWSNA